MATRRTSVTDADKSKSSCQKSLCDVSRRLRKARDLIERFFSQQVEVIGRTEPLPEIYYIEGTLQVVWVNHCSPGYGINSQLHPDCPNCCARLASVTGAQWFAVQDHITLVKELTAFSATKVCLMEQDGVD
ncbi:Zona pellucida-binding protein 1 [Varanus komodoensis]|nr:Zona pellucida-binding protein 1 [Varanus komodoensis]